MLVDKRKLKQYIENHFNVLFEGERGVGKTATIFSTFKEANLRIKYFSAPTMDPWTDLVGIPSTITRADGKEVVRMVPPEDFADDKYDVIFIDELNRAPPKVLNALMELIQFGTINGKEYKIKMIWAAINPFTEEGEYDVNPLDPALKDRFQIHIKVPYKVDEQYFKTTLGTIGEVFADWWEEQPLGIQKEISPRRLHEAAKFYMKGGDFTDMIDQGNTTKLAETLKAQTQVSLLEKDFEHREIKGSLMILNKNYSANVSKYLLSSEAIFKFFLPKLNDEWVSNQCAKSDKVKKQLLEIADGDTSPLQEKAFSIIKSIVDSNPNSVFVRSNIDKLHKYLPTEHIEKIELSKESLGDHYPQGAAEGKIVKQLFENNPIESLAKIGGTEMLHELSLGKMINLSKSINSLVNKGLDSERIKQLVAFKIAAYLSLHESQTANLTEAYLKAKGQMLKNPQYKDVWADKNIESYFSDMSNIITKKLELFTGLSQQQIKEQYLCETSKAFKRQHSRKMK